MFSIRALKDMKMLISSMLFKLFSLPKMLYKLETTLAKAIYSLKRRHNIYLHFFENNPFIFRSINQLNLRFKFCLQPLNLYPCFHTKTIIRFLSIQSYFTSTFLEDTPKKFSIANFKYIDLNNFKSFKSFFILNNIRKENGKFRFLLKNIIADPVFLIYSYKTIINNTNDIKPFELINLMTLQKINIHWFFQTSQLIKNEKFKWSYNFHKHILKKTTELESIKNKIIQKAIYLVLSYIYENKLNFFSDNSYGFRQKKNSHSALHKIKFDWHNINWYLEFYIEKAFNSLNQQILINIIKEDIQDQALFSLIFNMLKIKTWNKNKLIIYKKGLIQTSIMSPFFFNIYLTPLDRFIEKCINRYYIKTNRINYLFTKKKIKSFPFQSTSFNKLHKEVSK